MVRVTFTNTEVHFESDKTKRQHTLKHAEYPEVFGHPRHLMVNYERARPLLHDALKAVHRGLLAPAVEVRVTRSLAGGLADVDHRTLKDFLLHAGAKHVSVL